MNSFTLSRRSSRIKLVSGIVLSVLAVNIGCGTTQSGPEQVNHGNQTSAHDNQPVVSSSQLRESVEIVDVPHGSAQSPVDAVEKLIEGIASAPGDDNAVYRVRETAQSIMTFGPAAFPILMNHVDDDRYSFARRTPSGPMRNFDVGSSCGFIVEWELEVYEKVGVYPRMEPSYFREVVDAPNWNDWWSNHRHKSLVDLQIEATRWAIDWQKELLSKWQDQDPDYRGIEELRRIIKENEVQLAFQINSHKALRDEKATPFYKENK